LLKPQDYYAIDDNTWWSAFAFLFAAVNAKETLNIEKTKKVLYGFVIRAVRKYVRFINAEGDTKFRNAVIDSIKSMDWITYNATVVSASRFRLAQNLNLAEFDLPTFVPPEK